uniref:Putative peptidase n=1 Tax=Klebsiella pneumoniae TaxID=573 RepID=A0A8B0SXN3_KLEPN|nr:putative peptidase [Klebsiella pneumoniae]
MTKPRPFCIVSYSTKMHDQFINDVEAGRKGKLLSREQADKEQLYTGRFWLGDRAKQFGLIDDTATSTEVRERLSIVFGTTRFSRLQRAKKHR